MIKEANIDNTKQQTSTKRVKKKEAGGTGNQRKNRDHPDYSIVKIG